MSKLEKLSGIASHIRTVSSVSAAWGNASTSHSTTFRLGNRQVSFDGTPEISYGDSVVVVGNMKNGEFKARVVSNLNTNIYFYKTRHVKTGWFCVAFAVGILFSLPPAAPIFGYLAWYHLSDAKKTKTAIAMVNDPDDQVAVITAAQ